MGKNQLLILIIVGVVIIAGVYLGLRSYRPAPQPQTINQTPVTEKSQPSPTDQNLKETSQDEHLVEITAAGFSPQSITIKAGQAVTWINKDKSSHQVASAVHPTHLVYPPLNTIGLLTSGEGKPLVFPQAGTFKYHDHLNPGFTGEVVVE